MVKVRSKLDKAEVRAGRRAGKSLSGKLLPYKLYIAPLFNFLALFFQKILKDLNATALILIYIIIANNDYLHLMEEELSKKDKRILEKIQD